MRWLTARQRWQSRWLILSLASAVAGCTHPMPADTPVVELVLSDHVLREQPVTRGTLEEHFVYEVLHQLGQGPNGDHEFARLVADPLHHHPITARAVYGELARHKGFQEWLLEQATGEKFPLLTDTVMLRAQSRLIWRSKASSIIAIERACGSVTFADDADGATASSGSPRLAGVE